jgi:hypothetical protein
LWQRRQRGLSKRAYKRNRTRFERSLGRLASGLYYFLGMQVAQVQERLDFSSFVTVFQGLLWLMIHLAEGVLGITDGLSDHVQRFAHHKLEFRFECSLL